MLLVDTHHFLARNEEVVDMIPGIDGVYGVDFG
jgi:hypothetical protein